MADYNELVTLPLSALMGSLSAYKYNPTLTQRVILDHLEDITNGKINVVDPTNPFIFLLEASCVNTANMLLENELLLRKQYPSLAKTQEELYLHMSDFEYQDRFAVPATVDFFFYLEVNSMLRAMIDVPSGGYHLISIPANTEITVDDITFSMQYGVDIYKFYTGVVQVKYSTSTITPLSPIPTNMIDYSIRKDAQGVQWMVFGVPVTQFKITSVELPVQSSKTFLEDLVYEDKYYLARVYMKSSPNSGWVEILTTHTDQVYDPYKPTAVLTVRDGTVSVFIPPVYIFNNLVSGTIRVDIYQTKGKLDINFSNYELKAFSTRLVALDDIDGTNIYINAMRDVTYFSYTDKTISSGNVSLGFTDLRNAVIDNSIGDRKLPITPTQVEYWVDRKGFDLHKNIDVITNRVFVASRKIPRAKTKYPVTPMAFTVETLIETIGNLKRYGVAHSNDDRLTIPSYSVFELVNSKLRLLSDSDLYYLKNLSQLQYIDEVNSRDLLVNVFHYVLDFNEYAQEDEFDLRVYSLDYPKATQVNFVYQNALLNLAVNTSVYGLDKLTNGYRLTIVTKSGNFYKQLPDDKVGLQLALLPDGEKLYGYLNGELVGKSSDGERIFRFDLLTNYDIDSKDRLFFKNLDIKTNDQVNLPVTLTQEFVLLHYTNSITRDYKPSRSDDILGKFLLTQDHAVMTHELITLKFGTSMHNLWRHYRSAADSNTYSKYTMDIPMFYEEDVYDIDPVTGVIYTLDSNCNMSFNLRHKKGEVVKDADGNIVYKFRIGDVVLGDDGKPVSALEVTNAHFVDIMLMDYKYHVADRTDHVTYLKDVIATLDQWVNVDLATIDDSLLEQTRIYFKPKRTIGTIPVMVKDGVTNYIDILQTIHVKYYVVNSTYRDMNVRGLIEYRTIEILNDYLGATRVSKSDIVMALKNAFYDTIDTVNLSGIGGDHDLDVAIVEEEGTVMAINKKLARQEDGKYIVTEDVIIEFVDIEAG